MGCLVFNPPCEIAAGLLYSPICGVYILEFSQTISLYDLNTEGRRGEAAYLKSPGVVANQRTSQINSNYENPHIACTL